MSRARFASAVARCVSALSSCSSAFASSTRERSVSDRVAEPAASLSAEILSWFCAR